MKDVIKKLVVILGDSGISGDTLQTLIGVSKRIEELGFKLEAVPHILERPDVSNLLSPDSELSLGNKLAHDIPLLLKYIPQLVELGLDKDAQIDALKQDKVRRNLRFVFDVDENVTAQRASLGLDSAEKIMHHLAAADPSGKTSGCGCKLCTLRNEKYYAGKLRDSQKQERVMLEKLLEIIGLRSTSSPIDSKDKLRQDPFATDFLERQNSVYIKKKLMVDEDNFIVTTMDTMEDVPVVIDRINRVAEHLSAKNKHYSDRIALFETIIVKCQNLANLP